VRYGAFEASELYEGLSEVRKELVMCACLLLRAKDRQMLRLCLDGARMVWQERPHDLQARQPPSSPECLGATCIVFSRAELNLRGGDAIDVTMYIPEA
jgi:hypothetical protein